MTEQEYWQEVRTIRAEVNEISRQAEALEVRRTALVHRLDALSEQYMNAYDPDNYDRNGAVAANGLVFSDAEGGL